MLCRCFGTSSYVNKLLGGGESGPTVRIKRDQNQNSAPFLVNKKKVGPSVSIGLTAKMASIFEREPIFSHERPWDDSTKLPEKFKFSSPRGQRIPWDGVFYEKTLPDFLQADTKLNWSWYETFSKFENVLAGSYKIAWREVVKDHFSEERDIFETQNNEAGFYKAVRIFVCTILEGETPRDVQYVYLAPGGDHRILKDLLTAPRDHAR